jgi:hypothetical protein
VPRSSSEPSASIRRSSKRAFVPPTSESSTFLGMANVTGRAAAEREGCSRPTELYTVDSVTRAVARAAAAGAQRIFWFAYRRTLGSIGSYMYFYSPEPEYRYIDACILRTVLRFPTLESTKPVRFSAPSTTYPASLLGLIDDPLVEWMRTKPQHQPPGSTEVRTQL